MQNGRTRSGWNEENVINFRNRALGSLIYFFTCLFSRISHSTRTVGAARVNSYESNSKWKINFRLFIDSPPHCALALGPKKVQHDFNRSNLSIERKWWNMKSHHDATRRTAVFPGNCRRSTPNRNNNHHWQYRVSCRRCNAIENRESMSLSSLFFHCVNFSVLCGYADIPSLHFAPLQLILNFSPLCTPLRFRIAFQHSLECMRVAAACMHFEKIDSIFCGGELHDWQKLNKKCIILATFHLCWAMLSSIIKTTLSLHDGI